MLATATIVFREFLEIALVLTIVMAATVGLKNRGKMVFAGLALGVLGAGVIAMFTGAISNMVDGLGQEIFNAIVLFIAVGFLSWTVLWMTRYGREVAQELKQVGQDIVQGNKPFYVLIAVVALAVFREGAEIALFSHGMLASKQVTVASLLAGAALGALGGTVIGFMIYFGLLRAAQKHLLVVTSWMLIVLTAGMAAHGVSYLIAAGVVPELVPMVWDTSGIISGGSLVGQTLGVLIGYTPRPTGTELLVYVFTLLTLGLMYVGAKRGSVRAAVAA